MTNFEAVERFGQAHGARISKLHWIAGSIEARDFNDTLEEVDFERCFPELYKSEYFEEYREDNELAQMLVDFRKFGLLAEVHIPKVSKFRYIDDKPVGWSVHSGYCRVEYLYAETLEELMEKIEALSDEIFQEHLAKDRAKA